MQLIKITLPSLLLIGLFFDVADAGSFAEKFRRFVLGPEAEAYSYNPTKLDHVAEGCVGCHNGATAIHITVKVAEAPLQIRGVQTVNHPVGMLYDYYTLKKPRGFRPKSTLPSSIRFVDGKVTCISCHTFKDDASQKFTKTLDIANGKGCTAGKGLTAGLRETDLCMACHIK